ncbi:MAG TPA: BadF/BadG/BcrA/BcrD ATPase family protein [Rectinemataceae bacterium]|nr:BadF/BadG/BcrA/BcrD ATPase family protein [Rectinemataceae bacterium]
MRVVFGVDGGGTSTRLRLADEDNRELWEGRTEGVNPNAVPKALVIERLRELFAEAFAATALSAQDLSAGCLGIAGMDRAHERAEMEEILRGTLGFSCPLELLSDPDIALVGGLKRLEGYLLIAGTGSIAIVRLADGTRFRAGGLGHYLSDEGSAFYIGFQAICRSLRSIEGRDLPTAMLDPLLERFGLRESGDFVRFVYHGFDKARIAGAADLVELHRAAGDPLALAIMDSARDELVRLVASVRGRAQDRIADPSIVLSGGLLDHNPWLRGSVLDRLKIECPGLKPVVPAESASYGACMLAINLLGGRGGS